MTIPFARTRRAVVGSLAYRSPIGHHRFRPGFTLRTGEAARRRPTWPGWSPPSSRPTSPAGAHDAFSALIADSAAKNAALPRAPARSPGRSIRGMPPTRSWRRNRACGSATPSTRRPRHRSGSPRWTSTATRPRSVRRSRSLVGRRPGTARRGPAGHRPVARSAAGVVRRRRRAARRCTDGARARPVDVAAAALSSVAGGVPRRPSGGRRADGRRPARRPRAARIPTCIPPPRSARCGIRPPAGS